MNAHAFINVVVAFDAQHARQVNKAIEDLADPAQGNFPGAAARKQLAHVRGLHFMSLSVVSPVCPAEQDGGPDERANVASDVAPHVVRDAHAHLLVEISADFGPKVLLPDLATWFGDSLLGLLNAAYVSTPQGGLADFLIQHSVTIGDTWGATLGQVFSGSPGMTAARIIDEGALAHRLSDEIQTHREDANWKSLSARERLDHIRDVLWSDPTQNWKWAFVPDPAPLLDAAPDSKRTIFNPQIWKVAGTIFNKLLWPLYLPFLAIVLLAFLCAAYADRLIVALMWASYVACGLGGFFGLILGFALWRFRALEQTDSVDNRVVSSAQGKALLDMENFGEQNHLASVSRLKGGLLRRLTLRLAFVVVGTGRFVCAPGFLGKNGVIHFARWMRLPGTDQLLFCSNYDGTWESYVADFIADAPTGVTGIWSNCVGFPRTQGLFGGGAADRDRLVRWARLQQQPTRFWYCAYRDRDVKPKPNFTAERIRINAAIRQGFASAATNQDCEDWLQLFGSIVRPPNAMQLEQISTIAFGALTRMRYSASFIVSFKKDDIASARDFVAVIGQYATFGEALQGQTVAAVAGFSARGLERLGVPADAIETFPLAFKQGMWPDYRARALGDLDDNAPPNWKWGGEGKDADMIVIVYGLKEDNSKPNRFAAALRTIAREIRAHGHRKVFYQPMTLLQDKSNPASCGIPPTEPFGFRDGVSQPIIRGAPRWNLKQLPNDVVEAGEFIMGYPDNLGTIAPTPYMSDIYDPGHMLADAGVDSQRHRPDLASYPGGGCRDLGMNGTFLVVRHLRQNLDGFDHWFKKTAVPILRKSLTAVTTVTGGKTTVYRIGLTGIDNLRAQGEPEALGVQNASLPTPIPPIAVLLPSITIALPIIDNIVESVRNFLIAKLVGRWKDGASLVRNNLPPEAPDASDAPQQRVPDNDFLFGAEDPCGFACPLGAHIRRANPRDTRFPGSAAEIDSVNRHRILRVGRVFGNLDKTGKAVDRTREAGLFFMCLNGDIERQFEFVQKTWLLNPSLHGLENEIDPIIGRGKENRTFTVPTTSGPVCFGGLPDLTTLIGGGYFFIPGKAFLGFLSTVPGPPSQSGASR